MPGKVSRTLRFHGTVLRDSMAQFSARNAMTHAAAMAYYMVFSLPPILFIVIWTAAAGPRVAAAGSASCGR